MAADEWVLLRVDTAPDAFARMDADCRAFCRSAPQPAALQRVAWSSQLNLAYVYLRPTQPPQELPPWADAFAAACGWANAVRASSLQPVFSAAGASQGAVARFHYVVETDAEEGWMPEIARWYDTEHMPGLAAVPGCVGAARFLNRQHGPLSLACYDLESEATMGSPPWLAVRATPWSSRARPHFLHTRRTMFQVAPA